MPQNALLFSSFWNLLGQPVIGQANNTGALLARQFPGNSYYVDPTNGSDTTGNGSFRKPFATLAKAHDAATANRGDVVFFRGTITLTATLAWTKNGVSLVGMNGPSQNDRARIQASGTVFTPMVNVTAQGCQFLNVGTFYGFNSDTAQVCWAEAGGRNYYESCQFNGGAHATAAANAGCRSLTISNEGENVFRDCTFGLDTVVRATNVNATLEFLGGAGQRNMFYNPIFRMQSSLAGNVHVLAGASSTDRYQYMFNPIFSNGVDSSATPLTASISWSASAGGGLILGGVVTSVGAGKVAAAGPVYVSLPVPNTGAGIAVKAT